MGQIDGDGRRSVYLKVRRNFLSPMMLAFDMPTPFNTIGRRSVSNVPAQALILMNDPFVAEEAGLWAKRVLGEAGLNVRERTNKMYEAAFARPARKEEVEAAMRFMGGQRLGGRCWSRGLCGLGRDVARRVQLGPG